MSASTRSDAFVKKEKLGVEAGIVIRDPCVTKTLQHLLSSYL